MKEGQPEIDPRVLGQLSQGTFSDWLGIEFTEASPERVVATMEVTVHHLQPGGVLHGGATISLAETVASIGTLLNINVAEETCLGQEISASHLRGAGPGPVKAEALRVNRSRTAMLWDVRVTRPDGKLISDVRCTIAIRPRREG